MSVTIDAGGRLVVPKQVREAMGLRPGMMVDVSFVDGGIRIEYAPVEADLTIDDGLPRIVPRQAQPTLDDRSVRAVLETTRR